MIFSVCLVLTVVGRRDVSRVLRIHEAAAAKRQEKHQEQTNKGKGREAQGAGI